MVITSKTVCLLKHDPQVFVPLILGNQSSYGHGGQNMGGGYGGGYNSQSSMGGYNDYGKCHLCKHLSTKYDQFF